MVSSRFLQKLFTLAASPIVNEVKQMLLARDTLDGGFGYDIFIGGSSSDTFVLAVGYGTDTISDFGDGNDVIGLSDGLTFDDLSFVGSDILFGRETLATLIRVDTTTLSESQFVIL